MDVTFFARGLAIGFAIAAPVGAIGSALHPAHACRWPTGRVRLRAGCGDRRRFLRRRGGTWSDGDFVGDRRPSKRRAPGRRSISLLPRRAHGAQSPRADSKPGSGARVGRGVRIDPCADADQSDDDPLLRRGLRRSGARDHGGRSRIGRAHGLRRLLRIGAVVAPAQRRGWVLPPGADPQTGCVGSTGSPEHYSSGSACSRSSASRDERFEARNEVSASLAHVPPTAMISPSCGMAGALVMKSTTPS